MEAATNHTSQLLSGVSPVTPWPRKIYRNADTFWKDSAGLHYAYIVYRTLRGDHKRIFHPNAVLYVGKSPAAYLKTLPTNTISEHDVRDWQRFLWNQAVVPLLIVKSRTQIRVYTAYTQPRERQSTERIARLLTTTADAIELDRLYIAIEAGTIYGHEPEAFRRSGAVDQFLLDNLNAAAHQLAATQDGGLTQANLEFAHRFLTRLLFVCYLTERGMIRGKHFDLPALQKLKPASDTSQGYFLRHLFSDLTTYPKKRDALCHIFSYVKDRFNGSLFPEGITKEKDRYNPQFIAVLDEFLHAHNLGDQQLMLGFWAYDFSVIPIEMISAVYESFLGAQGQIEEAQGKKDSKRTTGAYYTPLHLAELAVDIALENVEKPIHKLKVLDPACGSGVFLVSLFARMAESLRRLEGHVQKGLSIDWADRLLPKLSQLYGIDINSTACHITSFSLYLALLEQLTPMHVEYLHKHNRTLPPLLADHSADSYNTVHHANVFDPQFSLQDDKFDIVIANPPWVSRQNQEDRHFLSWREQNPDVLGPDKQIAHGFMWKATQYLSDSGSACLLLPAAVLFNTHTNQFQAKWLKSVTVDRVLNFADLRWFLFPGAAHPCMAVRFTATVPDDDVDIRYESPKADVRSQQGGPIFIREEDTVSLSVHDIVRAAANRSAPLVWKSHYWGTWRDQRLINRLNDLSKLNQITERPKKKQGKPLIKGQGCQPYTETDATRKRKTFKPWWDKSLKFLEPGEHVDLVVSSQDLVSIPPEFDQLRRSPDRRLFEKPKVVVTQGAKDMKVAFSASRVLFRDSIQSIVALSEDDALLRFLTAVLKSDLARYYFFHTSANWATERDKVHFHELLSLPFFLPRDAPDQKKAEDIVAVAANAIKDFETRIDQTGWLGHEDRRKHEADRVRREVLEPLVREYYDIDKYEEMLIEDTLQLAAESFHPRPDTMDVPTLRTPDKRQLTTYTQTLCEMLNNFGKGSQFRVEGQVINGDPYSVVHLSLAKKAAKSVRVSSASDELQVVFTRLRPLLGHPQGRFVFCQNLKVFDGDDLYILKPMQMRFWSRTAALNEADELAGSILQSRRSH